MTTITGPRTRHSLVPADTIDLGGLDPHERTLAMTWKPTAVSAVNAAGGVWMIRVTGDGRQAVDVQAWGFEPPRDTDPTGYEWPLDQAPAHAVNQVLPYLRPTAVDAQAAAAFQWGTVHGFG